MFAWDLRTVPLTVFQGSSSALDGFLEKFTADPVATASGVAAALKGVGAPPSVSAMRDIAAAVAAAMGGA